MPSPQRETETDTTVASWTRQNPPLVHSIPAYLLIGLALEITRSRLTESFAFSGSVLSLSVDIYPPSHSDPASAVLIAKEPLNNRVAH